MGFLLNCFTIVIKTTRNLIKNGFDKQLYLLLKKAMHLKLNFLKSIYTHTQVPQLYITKSLNQCECMSYLIC